MNDEKMTIPCAVYEDLLPLVCDGLASEESRILVEEHRKTCPHCSKKKEKEIIKMEVGNETRILQKIKLQVLAWAFIPLLFGVFFGVSMGTSQDLFLNIWIMPLLGGISALIYKYKSFYLLAVVLFVSSFYHSLPIHYTEAYSFNIFLAVAQYGVLYAFFFFLGQVIGLLFGFAFNKEDSNEK